ncbi:response regulator transcription factor [Dyadobacter flavalbus]|uniref:Response regulator transcription factor n=1 Tax=Dyadobacter flavalbus TaxID=2579942 RepID=A0A5M8QT58_9BACT|nr:response regulator transcription factor [Dyadobacter flavalbus]KAA6438438.1 response regulator transcription factor [Dyadobacter flavalbus]
MIKVVVFDDHKSRREALELLVNIQPGMICTGAYEDCSNLVRDLAKNIPSVVLMDINMPRVGGIDGVKLLRKHFPDTCVIMQTVFENDESIFESILAGAHGYILKKAPNEKIIEAILEVMDGGAPMTPYVAARVLNYFNKRKPVTKGAEYELSPRELDILTRLSKGMSHKLMAYELLLSVHTIDRHIKNIYRKLHVHSASEAVAIALQNQII